MLPNLFKFTFEVLLYAWQLALSEGVGVQMRANVIRMVAGHGRSECGERNNLGSAGIMSLVIDVQVTDLVSGTNTLEFLLLNTLVDNPQVVTNVDLILRTLGSGGGPSP